MTKEAPSHLCRKRRTWIPAASAAGALALAAAVITGTSAFRSSDTVDASITGMVPADADTVVLAPYSAAFWGSVTAMADPETGLASLRPAEGLSIEAIGYSRSPDHQDRDGRPLNVFYIESPDGAAAAKVEEWLNDNHSETRRIHRVKDTVVVTETHVLDYKAPKETIAGTKGVPDKVGEAALMWMDIDGEANTLVADAGKRDSFKEFMHKGFGFKPGTTWTGTSADGATWAGDFVAGGVDPDQVDFDAAQQALTSDEEIIWNAERGNLHYEMIDPGMSALLNHTQVSVAGKGDMGGDAGKIGFPGVDQPVVEAVNKVAKWHGALTGDFRNHGLGERFLSANEKSMVVSYTKPKQ